MLARAAGDERDAWGTMLADIAHHIARGLNESHTFPIDDTIRRIRESFLAMLDAKDKQLTGVMSTARKRTPADVRCAGSVRAASLNRNEIGG